MKEARDEISFEEIVVQLRSWMRFLKSKRVILFVFTLAGALGGFTYAYLQKPVYTATTSFVLEDEKSGGSNLSGLASQFGFDMGGGGSGNVFSGDNLMMLMKSRSLVQKVLLSPIDSTKKSLSLIEYYIDLKKLRKQWAGNPEFSNIHFPVNQDEETLTKNQNQVLSSIYYQISKKNLEVEQKDNRTSIMYLNVRSEDELFSKSFAETLVKVVTAFYVETKSKKAKANVLILERQTDSVRRELNDEISGVAYTNDNVYNMNPGLINVKRLPSTRKQIDIQANTAILSQLISNLEISRMTLRKETPLIQIIDKPILPLEEERVSKQKYAMAFGFLCLFLCTGFLSIKKWWSNKSKSLAGIKS